MNTHGALRDAQSGAAGLRRTSGAARGTFGTITVAKGTLATPGHRQRRSTPPSGQDKPAVRAAPRGCGPAKFRAVSDTGTRAAGSVAEHAPAAAGPGPNRAGASALVEVSS
jgi:hypothetical protein